MGASPIHHTAVVDTPWNGAAEETAFDKVAGDFVKFYAWVDAGESDKDADGTDKEDGWGPHHEVDSKGVPGAANINGVHAAVAALNGAHGADSRIPDGDRQGVFDHLVAHLKDAGVAAKDLPELKSAARPLDVRRKPRARRELGRAPEFRRIKVGANGALEVREGTGATAGLIEVTGQVIVYEVPYQVYDPWGCFTETIHYGSCTALLASSALDVRFLFNHKDWPLARTGSGASLVLTDTPEALCIDALIDPRMSSANDLCVALERGLITQMSVGMEVDPAGDSWSGEDEWGMPNVRDIYRLANIFDVSAVTYPASPTTSIELAQRAWNELPVASRERTRKLWDAARDARAGRQLSQQDADALMHVLEQMAAVDTAQRAQPTDADDAVTAALAKAQAALTEAVAAQSADPDNGTDPQDKQVWKDIQATIAQLTITQQAQSVDSAPEPPEPPELLDDVYQPDPDGTNAAGDGQAPLPDNADGTGSRSSAPNSGTERRAASLSFNDTRAALYAALQAKFGGTGDDGWCDLWVEDFGADWVVFSSYGDAEPGPGMWQIGYITDGETITFTSDPEQVAVKTTYVPVARFSARQVQIDMERLRLSRPRTAA